MADLEEQLAELQMWLAEHGERAVCRCRERVEIPAPAGGQRWVRTTWEVYPAHAPAFVIVKERPPAMAGRSYAGQWELAVYDPDGPNERSTIIGDAANQDIAHLSASFDVQMRRPPHARIDMPADVAARYHAEVGNSSVLLGPRPPRSRAVPFAVLWFFAFEALCAFSIVRTVQASEVVIDRTRTPSGVGRTVELEAGDYTVWVEAPRRSNDRRDAGDFRASVSLRPQGGDPLPLGGYSGNVSTDIDGGTAYAFATVAVPGDGAYTLASTGEHRTVVLGPQGEIGRTTLKILVGAAIGVFGLVSALLIGIGGQQRLSRRWRREHGI